MSREKFANGKPESIVRKNQAITSSKGATVHQPVNIKMVQNVLLIWLDNNIDDNSADCQNTLTQLRCAVNTINTFTDDNQCIQFIQTIGDEKACMITSGSLGQYIMPRIHSMPQVDSIFIFCGNKTRHEQWAKDWPKIKGVFTEISSICEALKQAARQCERNATPMSFMDTSGDILYKTSDQLHCSFMYTQILKEILLSIKFRQEHIKEFIDYCRGVFAKNIDELKNVKRIEKKYHEKTPIWWYTYECFLYSMLNRALRIMDMDILIKMGFFIGDLHRHIEQLHSKQFNGHPSGKTFIVYRGQNLSMKDFDQMTKAKGGLMSFNNFLSTSKDRNISLSFTRSSLTNSDLVGILFVMTIDPSKTKTPFASINDISAIPTEDEILFSMHTIFRIDDIKLIDENNRLYEVNLTLTSDNDKDLGVLTESMREETEGTTGWYRLGKLLLRMGQPEKAQQVYEILLDQTTDEREKGNIYKQLGSTMDDQGKYEEAITLYEKSLEIYKKALPPNHPMMAEPYRNIGNVYSKSSEYSKALTSYEKALEIQQRSLSSDHPDLAGSYNNIGNVYCNMDEYSKALSYYEKALKIEEKNLPPYHLNLAKTYNNVGLVYENTGEYAKALSYYQRAVDIGQRTLPITHPLLQKWKNNLNLA